MILADPTSHSFGAHRRAEGARRARIASLRGALVAMETAIHRWPDRSISVPQIGELGPILCVVDLSSATRRDLLLASSGPVDELERLALQDLAACMQGRRHETVGQALEDLRRRLLREQPRGSAARLN